MPPFRHTTAALREKLLNSVRFHQLSAQSFIFTYRQGPPPADLHTATHTQPLFPSPSNQQTFFPTAGPKSKFDKSFPTSLPVPADGDRIGARTEREHQNGGVEGHHLCRIALVVVAHRKLPRRRIVVVFVVLLVVARRGKDRHLVGVEDEQEMEEED